MWQLSLPPQQDGYGDACDNSDSVQEVEGGENESQEENGEEQETTEEEQVAEQRVAPNICG